MGSACRLEVPGQQVVDLCLWVAGGHRFQGCLEVGEGFDAVDLVSAGRNLPKTAG